MKRLVFGALCLFFISVEGCASRTSKPNLDPVEMANADFRNQIQNIATQTAEYMKNANNLIFSSDPESDWVSKISSTDPINQYQDIGFMNGVWVGSFQKLIFEVAKRSGYRFIDLLHDSHILNTQITLPTSNSTLVQLLYTGYTYVPHEQIDVVVRTDTHTIILRGKCNYSDACDGLRKLSDGTPRTPDKN